MGLGGGRTMEKLPDEGSPIPLTTPAFDVAENHSHDKDAKRFPPPPEAYRLYKRRFTGVLGIFILNAVGGMGWPYFGPISNEMAQEFGITLDEVNWLGNMFALVYLPVAIAFPTLVSRYGVRRTCMIGSAFLLVSAWVRFAATPHSLSRNGAYTLLVVGQFLAAFSQPIFQIIGPVFSETWFNLRGRTTATMVLSIANPIGGAVGQLISPMVGNSRQSILVLGVIATVASPFVFLVGDAPPTPPTYAASRKKPTLSSLLRAVLGKEAPDADTWMTIRERIDFAILTLLFGVLVAAINTFSILSNQYLSPVGYSADISGFMGAALLLTGIVAAIITAPLFDRVFTHHLGLTTRILCPILAVAWLSLVWAVRPNNTGPLFVIMAIIGITSIIMLPVALELGCELSRNSDGSSSVLWFSGNLFSLIFVLVQGALRAGPNAKPPLNMKAALIFNAAFICVSVAFITVFRGKQARRERDEQEQVLHANLTEPESPIIPQA
ncbi:hypothetical protein JAAARDRAFT_35153 [Jaapia argillacea MUCL 33604]|uniref:Major facilitator superfamily (MFS) profile domain-containing protein n=1 Tax=Jaapia argillacea MUCL 33604 TaxID=933084 RepID=A0A067Q1U5_9AGAM|nr:hypothetical protein JAAARDRAFT_35153 [Jaapia argillacea MUCL 33604]